MNPHSTDPFDLLGVPARFDLEKAELEARQRELSKVLHPDRFATTGAAERRAALNKAISMNEAVRLLKNPVSRGYALLGRLLGKHVSSESTEARVSPSLLMEVMEWREQLADAFVRRDKSGVERVASTAAALRATTVGELTRKFEELAGKTTTSADEPEAVAIAQGLATLKYFERLAEEVRRMQDDLSDA